LFLCGLGQKVGITGANGVGKSSFFALIRDELHPDAGDFTMPPQLEVAHVAQETHATEQAAIEYIIDGDPELREVQQDIAKAEQDNSTGNANFLTFVQGKCCVGK
jgi:ATP-binding cassette subfamily F protein 3